MFTLNVFAPNADITWMFAREGWSPNEILWWGGKVACLGVGLFRGKSDGSKTKATKEEAGIDDHQMEA